MYSLAHPRSLGGNAMPVETNIEPGRPRPAKLQIVLLARKRLLENMCVRPLALPVRRRVRRKEYLVLLDRNLSANSSERNCPDAGL